LNFNVRSGVKVPVAVRLVSGSNGVQVLAPVDIAQCSGCGSDRFQFSISLGNSRPNQGDTYGLSVTYGDGDSETLNATVSGVLDAFATSLAPSGSGAGTTPTFTWSDPANASNYTYQFWLSDTTNGWNQIWQLPGQNSNSDGFSSTITAIPWNTDPTNSNSLPSQNPLLLGHTYQWTISSKDSNGNEAQANASFQP
jgi:hypothetical protein